MSDKKRYTQYNDINEKLADVTEEIDEVKETEEAVVEETEEKMETLIGVVSDCSKLNVRKEPVITSEPVCVVPVKSVLLVDPDSSTDEWYKVYTEAGMEGYCMKKYVTVKP